MKKAFRDDALKQCKNWRGHNGMTNADAYNAITKAVEQGVGDVTYDGKPWLNTLKTLVCAIRLLQILQEL